MIFPKDKRIWAWASYDFADTVYSALFVTFFYPILIRTYLGGTELQIGLVFGLAFLAAALLVPVLGAASDTTGRRTPILLITTAITVVAVALVGLAGLTLALALGFVAHLVNTADVDLYDSKISDVAQPREYGRVSGFGVALGYLGSIASLLMGYVIMSTLGWENEASVRAIFPAAAIFFAIFSIPIFLFVPDKKRTKIPFGEGLRRGISAIRRMLKSSDDMPGLRPFLLASFVYNDAMHTTIIFLSLFGTVHLGLSIREFFPVMGVMAGGAMIGSLIAGNVTDRIGPKKTIHVALWIWILVILLLLLSGNITTFLIAGTLGGAALGSVWTANRHMVTNLAPASAYGQVFGIEGLTEKTAGVIGPITYGAIATFVGFRPALFFLLALFVLGLLLLQRVPHGPATRLLRLQGEAGTESIS